MNYSIKDINLAKKGCDRIAWAGRQMNVIETIRSETARTKPFKGMRVGCCLHITTETANLLRTLKSAGASVSICASNPLSTQDDVAAALVKNDGITVFGIKGEDSTSYYRNITEIIKREPQLVIDDGADLIARLHKEKAHAKSIIGATEETTTGVIRLQNLAARNLLAFPVVAVNNAKTKHLFDNRYGTGQSTIDGILRSTNILLAGKTAVVAGYGWCGKGIARRFDGMGAKVVVAEVDPVRALEAAMDGFAVMPMAKAVSLGDIFVTATGDTSVIPGRLLKQLKDGAILANAGHFNVEIDVDSLQKTAVEKRTIRPYLDAYSLPGGKTVYLLGEGRLVNLACAEGHPAAVMDMSFANQFLALDHLRRNPKLPPLVHEVPADIDNRVASLKLKSMGIIIDTLTPEQKRYLNSWALGT